MRARGGGSIINIGSNRRPGRQPKPPSASPPFPWCSSTPPSPTSSNALRESGLPAFSILAIIVISLLSRIRRSLELHATHVHLDRQALEFMSADLDGPIAIIAHEPLRMTLRPIRISSDQRSKSAICPLRTRHCFSKSLLMIHPTLSRSWKSAGSSDTVTGSWKSTSRWYPNTTASVLLPRDVTGLMPHIYFRWTEGNPVANLLRFPFWAKVRSPRSRVESCEKRKPTSPDAPGSTWADEFEPPRRAWAHPRCSLGLEMLTIDSNVHEDAIIVVAYLPGSLAVPCSRTSLCMFSVDCPGGERWAERPERRMLMP